MLLLNLPNLEESPIFWKSVTTLAMGILEGALCAWEKSKVNQEQIRVGLMAAPPCGALSGTGQLSIFHSTGAVRASASASCLTY